MGWKDIFGKKKKKDDSVRLDDLVLSNLKVGWFLDYDMKTWEVEAYNYYDWGGGSITKEWLLKSTDDSIYLARDDDDEVEWSVNRQIKVQRLGPGIIEHIAKHDDPPGEITYEGTVYYLEEGSGGHFHKGGTGPGQKFLSWDFEDDAGTKFLAIEQWGEKDFEASTGISVEEWQFDNILPKGDGAV